MAYIKLLFMTIWSILCITSSMVIRVLSMNTYISVAMARTVWSPMILFFGGLKVKVIGMENIPDKNKPYIVVANHQSFLDIPVLFRHVPFNLYFVAKKELKKTPFIGWYMSFMGMIFIDRSNKDQANLSLDKAAQLIRNGKSVIIFPEGTRSANGELQTFKKGAILLAEKSEVPILPVYIDGTFQSWPSGKFSINSSTIQMTIGKPIYFKEQDPVLVQEKCEKLKNQIELLKQKASSIE